MSQIWPKVYSEFYQCFNHRSVGTITKKIHALPSPCSQLLVPTRLCLALTQAIHFHPDLLPCHAHIHPNLCANPQMKDESGRVEWDLSGCYHLTLRASSNCFISERTMVPFCSAFKERLKNLWRSNQPKPGYEQILLQRHCQGIEGVMVLYSHTV